MSALTFVDDMLSEAGIAAELERRRRRVAAGDEATPAPTVPALAWTLGGGRFATPLIEIYGVSGAVRTTMVPGAPAGMIGVFARRGVVHTLFDPAGVLGAAVAEGPGAVILLRQERPRVAIRVDEASAVIELPLYEPIEAGVAQTLVLADGSAVSVVDSARLIGQLIGRPFSFRQEG